MQTQAIAHEVATKELAGHLRPVFDSSPDGVYVWLDEEHWICNDRFALMFGYDTAEELNNTPYLLQRIVHQDDQEMFSWSYWNRVQTLSFPMVVRFRGIRKDGSEVQAESDMIPLTYGGHTFAYHFFRVLG